MLTQEQAVEVRVLKRQGRSIRVIARETGLSRVTVRRYLEDPAAGKCYGPRAPRPSKLDDYTEYLRARIEAARPAWIPASERGYSGGISLLKIFLAPLKRGEPYQRQSSFPHLWQSKFPQVIGDFCCCRFALPAKRSLTATRSHPGNAHENGNVESANGQLKTAIDQRLQLRGSHAFASREAYAGFLENCIQARNSSRQARVDEERAHLPALPTRPLPAYREFYATVPRASAVRVLKRSYSVSSRLIGCQLRVRLHANIVELDYKGERVAVMERLTGSEPHCIDYRHIIHALVRKPDAFRRYVFVRPCSRHWSSGTLTMRS